MDKIELKNALPEVFASRDDIRSEIWHREVTFERGHLYLVEAGSGTGKSSLCSYIIGYRNDYQGIISFDGKNIRNYKVKDWVELRKRSLSHLFQELRLFPELTAYENVAIKNNLTGFKKKKQIEAWFDALGIGDKLHAPISRMSFGQQQRVAMIRALVQPFDFLLADEPISHLDEENGRTMGEIMMEEARSQGAGVIVTSIGKHIALAGFFFANLLGMLIVLLSVQFYYDVLPVFTQGDSFIKKDYLIVSKRISMVSSFSGRSNTFSAADIDEIKAQKFCKSVGAFTSSRYKVSASMGVEGMAYMSTEMFFESVPDRFVDADLKDWHFAEGDPVVPIILPRSYLTIYNFGFAQSRSLPKLSEGVVSMLDLNVRLRGNGREGVMKGRVIGFSNRLNTILVPESFMKWSNRLYAPDGDAGPTRLIVEVYNPADDAIARFLQQKGYDTEEDKLDAGKTTYFLKIVSGVVMSVGLLISVLSFYILMLSIYLLVQKNTTKLENLLLIGYSPWRVGLPYQILTVGMNVLVLLLAIGLLTWLRGYYLDMILLLFPQMEEASLWPACALGVVLCVAVSVLNVCAIQHKVMAIWRHKD